MIPIDNPTIQIQLEVTDSCNCFKWCKLFRRRPDTATLMYVTADGRAERFDPQRAEDTHEALMKSVANLHKYIETVGMASEKSIAALKAKIEKDTGLCSESKEPPRMTLGLLEKINEAISGFFK